MIIRIQHLAYFDGAKSGQRQIVVTLVCQIGITCRAVIGKRVSHSGCDQIRIGTVNTIGGSAAHLTQCLYVLYRIVSFRRSDHIGQNTVIDILRYKICIPVGILFDGVSGRDTVADNGVALELFAGGRSCQNRDADKRRDHRNNQDRSYEFSRIGSHFSYYIP